jgi:hypothetical protein
MGHIAAWDEFTVADLKRIGRGRLPCLAAFREGEVDSWNAFLIRPRKLFPLPQIRAEFDEARAEMLAAINDLPEGLLAEGQMARTIFLIMANHERKTTLRPGPRMAGTRGNLMIQKIHHIGIAVKSWTRFPFPLQRDAGPPCPQAGGREQG